MIVLSIDPSAVIGQVAYHLDEGKVIWAVSALGGIGDLGPEELGETPQSAWALPNLATRHGVANCVGSAPPDGFVSDVVEDLGYVLVVKELGSELGNGSLVKGLGSELENGHENGRESERENERENELALDFPRSIGHSHIGNTYTGFTPWSI
ncbi:hypothetical protein TWF481_002122 [Arthrobotrys musiformis]|uniref:Uncharacterized protein n=1 Tax=Arthrobotrys musiformis TaxID=47236 RepID=A0AAV9VTZ2_9PEZI